MSSLNRDFDTLVKKLTAGRDLGNTGFEPVYYLIFPPRQILDVKRQTTAWTAKLKNEGWNVTVLSVVSEIEKFVTSPPLWNFWAEGDRRSPQKWTDTNLALSNALSGEQGLIRRFSDTLSSIEDDPNAVLLVTDLEGLHPYLKIGAIEGKLIGQFNVPTIFLYPGVITGQTSLKFLGFYPDDGNYRSVHIGG